MIDKNYIDNRLSHLKITEIKELLKKYYNNSNTIATLIENYNLDIKLNEFYKILPPIVFQDIICERCQSNMIAKRPSKSNMNNPLKIKCSNCHHNNDYNSCNCEACKAEKEEKIKILHLEKRNMINTIYDISILNPKKYEELSLYEKLYLSSVAREGLDENMEKIKPIKNFIRKISPTKSYNSNILNLLINNNILHVHPDSEISSFVDDENFPNKFYIYEVYYYINVSSDKYNYRKLMERIINPRKEDVKGSVETYYNLWIEIALEECKEYLTYNMNSVGFNFSIGDKTISLFKDLLKNFSVGQIYCIIYKGVTNATRYYQEKKITKKQAANSVISYCRNYGERAVINGWDIKPFNRLKNKPHSLISECFFNRYLNIAEKGFYRIPSKDIIEEVL